MARIHVMAEITDFFHCLQTATGVFLDSLKKENEKLIFYDQRCISPARSVTRLKSVSALFRSTTNWRMPVVS
jgi:hypothetical protein